MPRPSLLALALGLGASALAQGGTLTADPTSIEFGLVSVSAPASQSQFELTNAGSSTEVTGFSKTGSGCAEVTVTASLPALLAGGDSLVVTVSYDPVNRTADSCTVSTIHSGSGTAQVAVTGDGAAPVLDVFGGTLTFDDVRWNSDQSDTRFVSIGNAGEEPIATTNLSIVLTTGVHFSIGEVTGLPLANGESGSVSITFAPTSLGAKTDTATFSLDNDPPGAPNPTVSLSGTGTESAISFDPIALELSSYDAETNLHFGSLTVANGVGRPSLQLTELAITGTHAAEFELLDHGCDAQGPCEPFPSEIVGGDSDSFAIGCIAFEFGERSATLTVASDDPNGPTEVTLTCLAAAFSDGFESGDRSAWSSSVAGGDELPVEEP